MIRKLWLVFCQTATVCVAALFVVTTLRPDLISPGVRGGNFCFARVSNVAKE